MSSGAERSIAAIPRRTSVTASLYQLLVESVQDYAIFALDAQGYIITWNIGAERFKGYKPDEIIGQHFSKFYPAEDVAAGKPDMELVIAEKEGRVEDEGWRVRKDGSLLWANVVITALRDSTGSLVGFAKVTRDLTERREAEQRALAAASRLAEVEAANRAKAEFLAAMSHELRTPLNAIGGYAELLQMGVRGEVTQQQKVDLERIIVSQRHLLGIINDLLNFSRIEAGKLIYEIEEVDVGTIVDAVVQMVEPLASAKSIDVKRGVCPNDTVAMADRAKLEQVLINLASNAVNYTDSGGWLRISCGKSKGRVWASVEDNGIGISEENIASIFEPFVQVGRTLSTGHHGTGLGLAISRDLALGMKGELTVESELGKGSKFTIWVPAKKLKKS